MIYPNLGVAVPDSSIQFFPAGRHSWVKPVGASFIYMEVVAAGGGGGGGFVSADGGAGGGGSGGSGFMYMGPAMFFPDALTFSVGFGGLGTSAGLGAGGTGDSTSITYSATNQVLITCAGGLGGAGGQAAADGAVGAAASAPTISYIFSFGIFRSSSGITSTVPVTNTASYIPTLAGGKGSGISLGAALAIPFSSNTLPVGVNGTNGASGYMPLSSPFVGTGGNGGGRGLSGSYPAGNGGNGVLGCGGGGGGGWAIDGGGNGGKGGDGYVLIGVY